MLHNLGEWRQKVPLSTPELALVAITALWGATFLIVHLAMDHSGPLFFVAVRFLTAGLISVVFFWRLLRGMTWFEVGAGSAIGAMIFVGYALQTVGLQTIPSSTSAFITALYVPMVPFIQWIVFRKAPQLMMWIGAGLAFAGLILVAGPSATGLSLGFGELVTLISTVGIALEIILISYYAPKVNLGRVTVVQLLVAGALSLALVPVFGEAIPAFSWGWVIPAVGLGIASVLIQLTMNWAQKTVSPTRATVIYAGEPVWGGIVGRLAGERLPALAIVGAVLIVVGVLVSELKPPRWLRNPERAEADDDQSDAASTGATL